MKTLLPDDIPNLIKTKDDGAFDVDLTNDLHQALRSCNYEDIKNVLDRDNSEINIIDQRLGWSPLYKAVMYGDIKIVQLLLTMGANPNQPNKIGETPLHIAVENSMVDIVRTLLEHHANPNQSTTEGDNLLYLACTRGNLSMIKALIEYGANINTQNALGKTPLHVGCEKSNTALVAYLLSKDAKTEVEDKWGNVPLASAKLDSIKILFAKEKSELEKIAESTEEESSKRRAKPLQEITNTVAQNEINSQEPDSKWKERVYDVENIVRGMGSLKLDALSNLDKFSSLIDKKTYSTYDSTKLKSGNIGFGAYKESKELVAKSYTSNTASSTKFEINSNFVPTDLASKLQDAGITNPEQSLEFTVPKYLCSPEREETFGSCEEIENPMESNECEEGGEMNPLCNEEVTKNLNVEKTDFEYEFEEQGPHQTVLEKKASNDSAKETSDSIDNTEKDFGTLSNHNSPGEVQKKSVEKIEKPNEKPFTTQFSIPKKSITPGSNRSSPGNEPRPSRRSKRIFEDDVLPRDFSYMSTDVITNLKQIVHIDVNKVVSKPIMLWLREIDLEVLYQNFFDNTAIENTTLLSYLKSSTDWDKSLVTLFGIDKPGYRHRILQKVREDIGIVKRRGLFKMKYKFGKVFLPTVEDWLMSLKLDEWYENFLATGYDNMESILLSMFTNEPVDEKVLEEEIGIYEKDARILIYSKMIEDASKAAAMEIPENFEGEISFECKQKHPPSLKSSCSIF